MGFLPCRFLFLACRFVRVCLFLSLQSSSALTLTMKAGFGYKKPLALSGLLLRRLRAVHHHAYILSSNDTQPIKEA